MTTLQTAAAPQTNRGTPGAMPAKPQTAGTSATGDIKVSTAVALGDFMKATEYMRHVATETCAPEAPSRIGTMLSRLNYGGSGPETGCLLLAREGDDLVGFAVIEVKPGSGLEVSWLHAEGVRVDEVTERLWQKVLQVKNGWSYRVLHVGMFARLTQEMSEFIGQN